MKKKKFNEKIVFLGLAVFSLALFATALTGCETLSGDNCPYIIDKARIELGEKEEVCKYMGAYFDFFNGSEKTVTDFSVSFLVFDEDGKSPFLGSNKIVADFEAQIPSKESAEISLALDDYLTIVPETPYEIDYLYVQKIKYSDGSSWEDCFGMYARSVNSED